MHPTDVPAQAGNQVACLPEMQLIVQSANIESLPSEHFPSVNPSASIDIPLVTYTVKGNDLSDPQLKKVPGSLIQYQRDFETQRAVWQLFAGLIPPGWRGMIRQFQIITDGPGGVLSAVEQSSNDARAWILETDIADAADRKNLTFTLLHEFGHLLTLNSSQVPPDLEVFDNPDSTTIYDRAVSACPAYFPGEGCSLAGSYINTYFDAFWKDLYGEWSRIDSIVDDTRREARLYSFYRKYRGRFVDSYAVTSPAEDIAETWAFFVLSPRPVGDSAVDQKLDFFYQYPELVSLRQQILGGLCAANP